MSVNQVRLRSSSGPSFTWLSSASISPCALNKDKELLDVDETFTVKVTTIPFDSFGLQHRQFLQPPQPPQSPQPPQPQPQPSTTINSNAAAAAHVLPYLLHQSNGFFPNDRWRQSFCYLSLRDDIALPRPPLLIFT